MERPEIAWTELPMSWRRKNAKFKGEGEAVGIRRLMHAASETPAQVFGVCVDVVQGLCRADGYGISLRRSAAPKQLQFRCVASKETAKTASFRVLKEAGPPLAFCIDGAEPVLLSRSSNTFSCDRSPEQSEQVLLVPLGYSKEMQEGAIWSVRQDTRKTFDEDDAGVLQRFGLLALMAKRLARAAKKARKEARRHSVAYKELDHRLKNILQMAVNLLSQEIPKTKDPTARAVIECARDHMLAIGTIHQIGGRSRKVDVRAMLNSICTDMRALAPSCDIELIVPASFELPSSRATTIALIASELIINAIKYAFGDRSDGRITVEFFNRGNDQAELCVRDDGTSFGTSSPDRPDGGKGLGLVADLARQLGGQLAVLESEKRFVVNFQTSADRNE